MEARHEEEKSSAAAGGRSDANRQSGSSPPIRSRKVVEAAEALIASGLPVLALNPKAKEPLGRHAPSGFKSATTDVTVARRWFVASPRANIGIAPPLGVLVLDVDPRHRGTETLASLTAKHGALPETVTAITGAKEAGQHYYFSCPTELEVTNKSPAPGLDLKGHGDGYLVAPPSVHPDGGLYRWAKGRAPGEIPTTPAPLWLLDLVSTKKAKANGHDRDGDAQWVARLWEDGSPPGQQRHDLARLVGYYAKLRQPKDITIAQAWDLVQRKFRNGRSEEPWTRDDVVALAEDIYEKDSAPRAHGTQRWHVAKDVKPEKIDWIWPGRLARGKVTILDGDPAQAKTSVTIDLAARVSTGAPMPHEQLRRTPAGAVIVNYEDGAADTIVPRLIAAGADLSRIIIFDLNSAPTISDPEDLKMIEDAIKAVDAIYLVVDPLMAGVSDKADSHNDHKMRRALRPLAAMAERTHVAVLATRHRPKGGGRNAVTSGNGSIAIIGAARCGLLAANDPEIQETEPDRQHYHVLAVSKSNLAATSGTLRYRTVSAWITTADEPIATLKVDWYGRSLLSGNDIVAREAAKQTGRRDAVQEVADQLRALLTPGPLPATEVCERLER